MRPCSKKRGGDGCARAVISIDTNVVVRYLVADEAEQFRRATAVIERQTVFVCLTVFLEVEWVLRAYYRLDRGAIVAALRNFAGLRSVVVEDLNALTLALDWAARGMDFADALHLVRSTESEAFASFDRGLARAAAKAGALTVRTP